MAKNLTAALKWQQFSYQLRSGLWKGIDWIFPPQCPGCQTMGTRWCEACSSSVKPISGHICPVCGEPGSTAEVCFDCRSIPPAFDSLRSYTLFTGPIREALHHLKYSNDIGLGEVLSPYLVKTYQSMNLDIDLVTAVPLSKKRLRSRGYNQAEELARPFAAMIKKPYLGNAVERVVDTRSQIDLSAEERRENVSGAFYANSMSIKAKSVIIIDDVSTTGSTISECAGALRKAGAREIHAITLARAPLKTTPG